MASAVGKMLISAKRCCPHVKRWSLQMKRWSYQRKDALSKFFRMNKGNENLKNKQEKKP
jgi:hypothetical protein